MQCMSTRSNVAWAAFACVAFAIQNVTIFVCVALAFPKVLEFERARALDRNGTATRALRTAWEVGLPPVSFSGVFRPERLIFHVGFIVSACAMALVLVRLYAVIVNMITRFPSADKFACACCVRGNGNGGGAGSEVLLTVLGEQLPSPSPAPTVDASSDSGSAGGCCAKCVRCGWRTALCECVPLRCAALCSLVLSLVAMLGLGGLGGFALLTPGGEPYWGTFIHESAASIFFICLVSEEWVLLALFVRLRRLRRGGCGVCGRVERPVPLRICPGCENQCLYVKIAFAAALPLVALAVQLTSGSLLAWQVATAAAAAAHAGGGVNATTAAGESTLAYEYTARTAQFEAQSASSVVQWTSILLLQCFYIACGYEFVAFGAELE